MKKDRQLTTPDPGGPLHPGAQRPPGRGPVRLMQYVLFSYDGRISRNQYWIMGMLPLLAVALLWGVAIMPLAYFFPWASILVSIGAIVFLAWGFAAVSVKRCHDIGYSGFWTLFYLIPGVGLVGLVVLGAWPSSGPNRYDQVEEAPAWLRRGENNACPPCSPQCVVNLLWAIMGAQLQRFSTARL